MKSRKISQSKNIVWFGKDGEQPIWTFVEIDGIRQNLHYLPENDQLTVDGITYDLVYQPNSTINGFLYLSDELKGVFTLTTPKAENYETGKDGVADSLTQTLSVIKGELWYNLNYGLPLFDKVQSTNLLDMEILSIITRNPGVSSIDSYTSSIVNHTYSFSCKIRSIYGEDLYLTNTYNI